MYIIIKSVFNLIYYEHLLHSYWGSIPWHIQKSECLLQFVFNFPTSQTPIPPPFLQPNYFQINIQMFSQFFLNAFLQLLHQQFL